MQSINCCDNIEGVSIVHFCEVCHEPFSLMWEEEAKLSKDRIAIEYTICSIRRKFICNSCYRNNWKFTEHGVLINETLVKKRGGTK